MPSEFDETEFVDSEFQAAQKSPAAASPPTPFSAPAASAPPPDREEIESQITSAQQKLAELKREQEQLERERIELEEARRRRVELQTGREEMLENLIRGVELLQEAEFAARRDAEQMGKSLVGLREALTKIQSVHEDSWTAENYQTELTRALTAVENARMEWNGARLKWPLLNGSTHQPETDGVKKQLPATTPLSAQSFWTLCKLGLALTWPLALLAIIALVLFGLVLAGRVM